MHVCQPFDWLLLERLCAAQGLSGLEDPIARLLADELRPVVDHVTIDRVGNVVARLAAGDADAPTLMIYSHIDQVGFRVKRVRPDGLLTVSRSGGGLAKSAAGSRVQVGRFDGGSPLVGVVGLKSDHLTTAAEAARAPTTADLYIDLGAESADEVKALGVRVGCSVTYCGDLLKLPGAHRFTGPSLDDRIGCALMVLLARKWHSDRSTLPVHLAFIGVTREEVSCRGLRYPARCVAPDLALGIDCTVCYDTPDTDRVADVSLGGGPVVPDFISAQGLNAWSANPKMYRRLIALAEEHGVPHQLDSLADTILFDAQILPEEGIPSAIVYIPNRCTHSAVEVADMRDVMGAWSLVDHFIAALPMDTSRG